MFMGPRNWFQGMHSASLRSLAGRYDNPIPPRFLAPIDFLKIPALFNIFREPTCSPCWDTSVTPSSRIQINSYQKGSLVMLFTVIFPCWNLNKKNITPHFNYNFAAYSEFWEGIHYGVTPTLRHAPKDQSYRLLHLFWQKTGLQASNQISLLSEFEVWTQRASSRMYFRCICSLKKTTFKPVND
jgi:hypothetical protein